MATRSLTAILDSYGNEITTIYNQYDGYPSGYGVDLAEFLSEFIITEGITKNSISKKTANGMGCLAGQVIAHFKKYVGGIYLYPSNTRGMGTEYLYIVSPQNSNIMIKFLRYDNNLYEEGFYGSPEEFIAKFKNENIY